MSQPTISVPPSQPLGSQGGSPLDMLSASGAPPQMVQSAKGTTIKGPALGLEGNIAVWKRLIDLGSGRAKPGEPGPGIDPETGEIPAGREGSDLMGPPTPNVRTEPSSQPISRTLKRALNRPLKTLTRLFGRRPVGTLNKASVVPNTGGTPVAPVTATPVAAPAAPSPAAAPSPPPLSL